MPRNFLPPMGHGPGPGPSNHGMGANSTVELMNLPATLLEAFIPGYSLISRFALDMFGFDASLLVSSVLALLGLATTLNYAYRFFWTQINAHFTASIAIEPGEDIYDHVLSFISNHPVSNVTRHLRARDGRGSLSEDEYEEQITTNTTNTKTNTKTTNDSTCDFINLAHWDAQIPPKFDPYATSRWFWHRGHIFRFQRDRFAVLSAGGSGGGPGGGPGGGGGKQGGGNASSGGGGGSSGGTSTTLDEQIAITVLGRSAAPIKSLIAEASREYFARQARSTTVRRPTPKMVRGGGRFAQWTKVAVRPSRPIETVVLDEGEKRRLLSDINEYLHPATRKWYANRGIPYRRGYLFYGPPGTGKTSLSFAIAGIFGVDIFSLSLLDPSLTEEDLGFLFSMLPRHCVVLLEDIDSAGLTRTGPGGSSGSGSGRPMRGGGADEGYGGGGGGGGYGGGGPGGPGGPGGGYGGPGGPGGYGGPGRRRFMDEEQPRGISLAGLLNAIDGVASHEGRVLVMTTNHPDTLDAALIRPGRVDMMIGFTLATRSQIAELFKRMYADHPDGEKGSSLEALADQFASSLPDSTLSPAEVQGYLLMRKKEPRRAVDEVDEWREEILEAKRAQERGDNIFDKKPRKDHRED
ncbi:hypothetical protein ASPZODRAFT_129305 [Penicilliopsis zonata CBS 506.65]|uniref:AAA+ ATPase domain-containing protein n=1 Tax=Penicilliopsis zonata CBS 506.65 TaxID=1073090 RepID=A0A1L9SPC4_9EURO|nr:hypothetical protein ASPZODRAFT_129305 [Penicilliopsis zonata CBS 506.65]OJJ48961.1 hypothetical protein ASPZODRAFT_129305 [Penicilliopsis zonata CBS 506.65]